MSITAPTLSISPDKVCFFIDKAHEFDIDDSGANVADEGMIAPCVYRKPKSARNGDEVRQG